MTIANASKASTRGLPPMLRAAQEAIHLPEVQEMLRRLSEYKLGILMPHMHDERTGQFQPLPDKLAQVESGLEVSFQPIEAIADQADRFLPVGWIWRAGAATSVAVCEMVWEDKSGDTERYGKHKMVEGNRQTRIAL